MPIPFTTCICTTALLVFLHTCVAQYRVVPGDTDENGCSGNHPAQLCFDHPGAQDCYALPNDKNFIFGLGPKAQPIGKWKNQPLILLSATFSGCGSGTLTEFALLTSINGKIKNLLPRIELTDQSEYRLWNLPPVSKLPVLVTADFVWDFNAGETHFGSHHYRVAAYVFNPYTGGYVQRVSFVTARRYSGEDASEPIRVLASEKPKILAKLTAAH